MSYQENILQAVDMVVSQRLNEMSFDKTIVCKVEDDTNASKGEYTVSYQAMTMVVYAANPEEEYKQGQQVYVTVPQGDFNLRKIIIGYVSSSEIPTYLYTNPMKYMVRLSDNLMEDKSLGETLEPIILRDYSEEGNMPPIKYLCFAADFRTSGTIDYTKKYGIKITGKGRLKENKEQEKDFEWIFDSTQFQGNSYAFNGLFRQEQLFNIERFSELNGLTVELFNENENFEIAISNVELYYGYAKDDLTDEVKNGKIIIYEKDSKSTYKQDSEDELNISIKYFSNNSIQDNTSIIDKITWFRYDITQKEDEGNGKHWAKIIDQNDPKLVYYTNKNQKSIQIMAKLTIDNNTYTSNNLVFLREDQKDIEGALKGSGIELTASEDGNYFIYDGATMLVNKELKNNKNFRVTAKLTGAAKWNPGTEIRWYIPKFGTMIAPPDKDYLQTGETVEDNIDSITNEKYYIITRTIAGETPYQSFDIKDKYDISATSNVIRCEAGEGENKVDDGVLLNFGISGSQGTEYTMTITFDKDSPTYAFIDASENPQHHNVLTAVAHLYKPDGTEDENVKFYWGGKNDYISLEGSDQDTKMYSPVNLEIGENFPKDIDYYTYNIENKQYIKVTEDKVQENIQYYKEEFYKGKTCKITVDTKAFDTSSYYGIISATVNNYEMNDGRNITFKTFLAIPVWWAETSEVEMHGPTSVVYNFQGMNPQYSDEEYTLNNNKPYNTNYFSSSRKDSGIKVINNKLLMPELISTTIPKITVVIQKDEEQTSGLYFQPIAISRNQYTSALLNSWNDNEQFNDGTTILTKMIGAGDKDAEGRFSGVFMGAVGQETEDGITGLYGYKDGALRFKFTEKGEGYMGTGSDNHIEFADGKFEIKAQKFTLDSAKLYLSGDTTKDGKYFNLGNKLTFDGEELVIEGKITAKAGGKVGGWYIADYYLRSENNDFTVTIFAPTAQGADFITIYDKTNSSNSWPFTVTSDGSLYVTKGKIGNWNMDSYKLWKPVAWDGDFQYGTGMAATSTDIDPAFYAGFAGNGGNPWDHASSTIRPEESKDWKQYTRFYVLNNGTLYASNATIKGTLQAGSIITNGTQIGGSTSPIYFNSKSTNSFGLQSKTQNGGPTNSLPLAYIQLSEQNNNTMGKIFIGTYSSGSREYTEISMTSAIGSLFGTWKLNGADISTGSDKNIKNSIENLPAQYSNLIYYLNPVRYKYNDGTSNRYHTGFITQEVEQALNVCGINTQDFAGLVGFDRGTENETWGLRYSEFIALNTAAIQAQKKEIDELSQQLAEIKEKLQ